MKLTNYNNNSVYNPFSLLDTFEREFNRPFIFGDITRTGDTIRFKEGDEFTVEVDLPGVPKDKTKVTVEGRVVNIEGSRKLIHKGGESEETYTRSFAVNQQYNIDKGKATQIDGVLTLIFPKNKVENGGKKIIDIT
jgi:HSP20 family protein